MTQVAFGILLAPVVLAAAAPVALAWGLWQLMHKANARVWSWRIASASPRAGAAPALRRASADRVLILEPRATVSREPIEASEPAPYRHSVDDLRRSLAGMVKYAWPKSQVLQTLEAVGARWIWSDSGQVGNGLPDTVHAVAREHVHLRYRVVSDIMTRLLVPPACIDLWFDGQDRLVHACVQQPRGP